MTTDHRTAGHTTWLARVLQGGPGFLPLVDLLLAAGLTVVTCVSAALNATARPVWAGVVLGGLIVAPLAFRQSAPLLTAGLGLAASITYVHLGYGYPPDAGLGMLAGMFTVATLCRWPAAALTYLGSFGTMLTAYRTDPVVEAGPRIGQALLVLAAIWTLGASTRRWSEWSARTAVEAAEAVAADRARIARDMHDVVAHHISVIALQAGVAEYVLKKDPDGARAAVATVAESSREALHDMRRMLDVLRREDDTETVAHPDFDALAALVERTRRAGLDVEYTITGDTGTVPAGHCLCAYRVVQESLTNVLKHARPARARVEVTIEERTLTVTIQNDGGSRGPVRESPTAYGIRGMRERAEMYDGILTAGPSATGFRVRLVLPLEVAKEAAR